MVKKILLLALALIAVGCAEPIPRNVEDLVRQGDTLNPVPDKEGEKRERALATELRQKGYGVWQN